MLMIKSLMVQISALDFRAADIARTSLQKACKEMAKEVKPSRLGKIGSLFGKQRKSTKQQANEVLESFIVQDFDDLKLFVENQETQWKSSHGKVGVFAWGCTTAANAMR